jgi:hypothetical protein
MRNASFLVAVSLAVSSAMLVGCAAESDGADVVESASAAQTQRCVSYATAKATYDRAVEAATARLLADYDTAMAAYNADVAEAKRVFDEALASVLHGSDGSESSDVLNAAVKEYNRKVAPDGPLVRAYNERTAAAKGGYEAAVQAAKDTYNASICH